jgi:hypothetical protein
MKEVYMRQRYLSILGALEKGDSRNSLRSEQGACWDDIAQLTKTTMVWEAEVPWTMVTVAVRLLRLLLIRRLAGMA